MAENKRRSFSTVVWKTYDDEIEKAVSAYIDDNWQQLDLQSHKVKNPDEAHLEDLRFQRLMPYNTPGDTLKFDVVVIAGIMIFIAAFQRNRIKAPRVIRIGRKGRECG